MPSNNPAAYLEVIDLMMAADRGDWQAMRNSDKKVKVESLKVKNNIYAWEHQSRCVLFK